MGRIKQRLALVVDCGVATKPNPISAATEALQLALGQLLAAQAQATTATLGELVDAWLRAGRWTTATRRGYVSDTAAVLALVGDRPLADLTAPDLEVAIDQLPAGRWNAVSLCWRACLRWGERHGFPGAAMLLPEARRHRVRRHTYGEDVWRRAVLALAVAYRDADPRSRAVAGATLLAVLCGVRRLACASMRWGDVDEARGRWTVTDKGITRLVDLGPIAWPLVLSQPRRGAWVWPARRGSKVPHVGPDRLSAHARRAFKGIVGLEGLSLHKAGRHAAACAVLTRGGSLADVAGHLGHVDLRTAATIYTAPANGEAARRALYGSLAEVGQGRSLIVLGPGDSLAETVHARRRGGHGTSWIAIEATRRARG